MPAPSPDRRAHFGSPRAFEPDVEVLLGEPFGHALAPLDDDDGVVQIGVEVQRVQFAEQVRTGVVQQPVHVDVHHRGRAGLVAAGCTRANTKVGDVTGPSTSIASAIPLASTVFPAPSGPDSTTTSPGAQLLAQLGPERHGVLGGARSSGGARDRAVKPWGLARSRNRRVSATSLDGVARSTSRTSASSMISGCSSCTRCPAPSTITSSDFGSAGRHRLGVLDRGDQIAAAAGDQRRHLRQRRQRRVLVVHLQRVQEPHQRGDRGAVHHLLGERHHARADLLVAVGRGPQDRGDHRLGRAAGRGARSSARSGRRTAAASSAGFFRISPSGDRATPSAAEEISATPTMRVG